MNKLFSFVLLPALISPVAVSYINKVNPNKEDKFDSMRTAYKLDLMENTNIDSVKDLGEKELFSQFNTVKLGGVDTYKYKDINYEDDLNKSSWPAATHLGNTLKLAVCYEKYKDEPDKEYFKKAALGLTYHWVYSYYKNANWWMNDLSANQTLTSIGLFLYDDLNPKGQAAFRGKAHYGSIYYAREKATHTGGNLFNYVDLTLKDGIVTKNDAEIQFAMNRLEEEITDKNVEGFQTDGSFFQHGRAVQTLSYGGTVINIGRMLSVAGKGGYGINKDKLTIISNWINRGARSLIHKGNLNYMGVSREYSRPNSLNAETKNFGGLEYYTQIDGFPEKQKLIDFLNDMKQKSQIMQNGEMLYFDVGKYASTVVDGVYFSVRGSEPNLTNTECVNHENRLGLNLSYGTNTAVLSRGDEYTDISPLLRYDYMPGTTSWQLYDDDKDNEPVEEEISDLGKKMWVFPKDKELIEIVQDTYKDGLYEEHLPEATEDNGYVYTDALKVSNDSSANNVVVFGTRSKHHGENEFTVTNILYNDGLISIGSNLKYTGEKTGFTNKKLHTTLEQCNMSNNTKVTISDDKKTVTRDSVVYTSLSNQELTVKEKTFTPEMHYNWYRNNTTATYTTGQYNDVKGKTLTISMENASSFVNNYAYVVRPESHTGEGHEVELVDTKSNDIHCVRVKFNNRDQLIVVYYKDGTFTYNEELYEGKKGDIDVIPLK